MSDEVSVSSAFRRRSSSEPRTWADDSTNKMEADLKNIHQLQENREKHIYTALLNVEATMKEHIQTCANNSNKLKEELVNELIPIIKTAIREGIREELPAALPALIKELLKKATISLELPTN